MVLGAMAGIYLLLVYNAFAWGWVAYKFWYWFLIPVFPMVPHVTFVQVVGLLFFTVFFKSNLVAGYKGKLNKTTEIKLESDTNWIGTLITPWFTLFIAWLIKFLL